jgi:hypothetical protein
LFKNLYLGLYVLELILGGFQVNNLDCDDDVLAIASLAEGPVDAAKVALPDAVCFQWAQEIISASMGTLTKELVVFPRHLAVQISKWLTGPFEKA